MFDLPHAALTSVIRDLVVHELKLAAPARFANLSRHDIADDTRLKGGTGLGLTISRRLAELHGGSLTMESQKNSGTVVTVKLPLAV